MARGFYQPAGRPGSGLPTKPTKPVISSTLKVNSPPPGSVLGLLIDLAEGADFVFLLQIGLGVEPITPAVKVSGRPARGASASRHRVEGGGKAAAGCVAEFSQAGA